MTSLRDEYRTPPAIYAALDREFHFAIDLAADADNAKAPRFFTGPCDRTRGLDRCYVCGLHAALEIPRGSAVWCNPPYSTLRPWVERFETIGRVAPVVALLPVAFTSRWFWEVVEPTAHEIRIFRDRVNFEHAPACTCKACLTGADGGNRGENFLAVWLPYRRPGAARIIPGHVPGE